MSYKDKQLISVAEAAKLLGISRMHVIRKIHKDEIKATPFTLLNAVTITFDDGQSLELPQSATEVLVGDAPVSEGDI